MVVGTFSDPVCQANAVKTHSKLSCSTQNKGEVRSWEWSEGHRQFIHRVCMQNASLVMECLPTVYNVHIQ